MENKKAILDWVMSNEHPWARKMALTLIQYGSLTANQLATSERVMNDAKNPQPATELDIAAIESAFARAKLVVKKPKMTLQHYTFKCAPEHGKNPGAIYITDRDHGDQYLGKVLNGQFSLSRECTEQQLADIRHIAADPRQAAIAYGKEWNCCCICNRTLTDPDSVQAGIGPICAERFGW